MSDSPYKYVRDLPVTADSSFTELLMKPSLFLSIAIGLLTVWVASLAMFHVASMMVHLLLLVAILFLAGHLVEDTTTT